MPLFFVLAFLLSWPAWPLVILNPESSPLLPFGPLIAGSAAGLPLLIISHATVDTAARFVFRRSPRAVPSSSGSLAGLWVVTAVVVAVRGRWSGAVGPRHPPG